MQPIGLLGQKKKNECKVLIHQNLLQNKEEGKALQNIFPSTQRQSSKILLLPIQDIHRNAKLINDSIHKLQQSSKPLKVVTAARGAHGA